MIRIANGQGFWGDWLEAPVRLIEQGPIVDGLRVIRSGLAATDRIVIDGLQRARPGSKVKPEEGKIVPPPQASASR